MSRKTTTSPSGSIDGMTNNPERLSPQEGTFDMKESVLAVVSAPRDDGDANAT